MTLPSMTGSVLIGPLAAWMIVLAVKHVVADFMLQSSWMALGKDRKSGWAMPLLAHCLVHGVMTTLLFAVFMPRLWFLGLVDFIVHLIIDRAKGLCVSTYEIGPDHRWFWWLIGIDQTLHHLTGFGLALLASANS